MTATLPSELRDVFERCTTAELVSLDDRGHPVARAVAPVYRQGGVCIDIDAAQTMADPRVALLFADADPCVLVQGTAQAQGVLHVRPERVYAWPATDPEAEPRLFDAHLEEVRSGHNEEPEVGPPGLEGGAGVWDGRLDALDAALLACVGPDGFPFAAQLAVAPDRAGGVVRIPRLPVGMPIEPGPACLHRMGTRVRGDLLGDEGGWRLVPHAILDD
jgi:hypothetical protein